MSQEPAELNVSAYMTADPITVTADVKFFDAVTIMYKNRIGNLVVTKDNEAVGLISERQIIHYLVSEETITDKPMSHIATSLFTKISPDTTILDAAKIRFEKNRKLLVFKNDKLAGIITTSDMLRGLRNLNSQISIDHVLAPKMYTCSFQDTVFDQIKLMHEKRIGSVIVNKDNEPYGIFTERDLICNALAIAADMSEEVGRYCSHPLITADVGINFQEASDIMATNKIKRLPLKKEGRLTTIVCACDLLKAFEKA